MCDFNKFDDVAFDNYLKAQKYPKKSAEYYRAEVRAKKIAGIIDYATHSVVK